MKIYTTKTIVKFLTLFWILIASEAYAIPVTVEVNWPSWSSENRVRILDTNGVTVLTHSGTAPTNQVCDTSNCYNGSANSSFSTTVTYDIAAGNGYRIVMDDTYGDGWNGTSYVRIYNGSTLVFQDDGPATFTQTNTFNISGGTGGPVTGSCGISSDKRNNWTAGTFNYNENNIDGSGVNMSVAVTGETGQIPTIQGGVFDGVSGLDLRTNGFLGGGATFTYTFSQGLATAGFNFGHVNRTDPGGLGGDSFTITGLDSLGNTIYPTFTTYGSSYTANPATGFVDANGPNPENLGVLFSDPNLITQVIINWNDCTNCNNSFHGMAIGEMNVCLPVLTPEISLQKTVSTIYDPVNKGTNPKSIPGSVLEYTISGINSGGAPSDLDSIILSDLIPANTKLCVTATTVDGLSFCIAPHLISNTSNLSLGSLSYFNSSNGAISALPADAEGANSNIAKLTAALSGVFPAQTSSAAPTFSLVFRVVVD